MSRNRASALLVAALLADCGGTSGPSAPSTPAIQQVAGTYSGPTTDNTITPPQQVPTWQIKFSFPGSARTTFRNCAGTLVLQQTGSTLTGSFTQQDACGGRTGQVSGVVNNNGTITFSLSDASDALAWTGFAHCTAVVPGSLDLYGTVSVGLLNASFPHDALIQCPAEGTVTVNVQVRGTR